MKQENEPLVEKYCPSCGAPTDPMSQTCRYCGTMLPGISQKLAKDKEASESTAFKNKIADGVFDYLDKRQKRKEKEGKEFAERQRRESRTASILGICLFAVLIALFLMMFIGPAIMH